jgi:hypothetical protein
MFLLVHKCQQSLNELFNDALKAAQVILEFEERYKDIGCQVCTVLSRTVSGRGQLRKSAKKSSRWDWFRKTDCVTSIRWQQLRITFSLRKTNGSRKPEIFYRTFDCFHLDQNRTRPGTKNYLCCRAQARPSARPCTPLPYVSVSLIIWAPKLRRPASADAIASTKHASPVNARRETYFKLHTPLLHALRVVLFASSVCGPLKAWSRLSL